MLRARESKTYHDQGADAEIKTASTSLQLIYFIFGDLLLSLLSEEWPKRREKELRLGKTPWKVFE